MITLPQRPAFLKSVSKQFVEIYLWCHIQTNGPNKYPSTSIIKSTTTSFLMNYNLQLKWDYQTNKQTNKHPNNQTNNERTNKQTNKKKNKTQ